MMDFWIFEIRDLSGVNMAKKCHRVNISRRSVKPLLSNLDLTAFNYDGRPPSWISVKLEILTARSVSGINMYHRTKFRGDRLNRCLEVAIYRFLKCRPSAILDL